MDAEEIEIIDLDYEDYHKAAVMNAMTGIRMKNPAHSGGFIKHEIRVVRYDGTIKENGVAREAVV